jgi:SSS family solute:Na+ symporter
VVITDFIQYFIALAGSVTLAVFAVGEVGGLGALVSGLEQQGMEQKLHFVPEMNRENLGPVSVFLTYVMVQWWAHKYADGGGKHIQRMLSAKNEQHAFAATLLYAFINYAVQVWPWILTALASLLLFGQLADHEQAYSMTMARVLPAGLLGLVLASLIGAFMSTVDTHLNLGASYMINDIYRRFVHPRASERHYVWMSRLAMLVLLAISIGLAMNMDSVAGAWKFLLTFAAGAGPVWIIRWYWWRINAWSEFSAMIASGMIATWINIAHPGWLYSQKLVATVALTALVWVPVTFFTAPVARERLQSFVCRIRPGGYGWRGFGEADWRGPGRAVRNWLLAVAVLFGFNFGLGWILLR